MRARTSVDPRDCVREAAERLASAHANGVRPEDDLALAAWRREHQAHESAFQHAVHAWEGARALRDVPGYADLLGAPTWRERWVAARRRRSAAAAGAMTAWPRGWALACGLLLSLAAVGALFLLRGADYRTQVAETREIRLDDGSIVTLGARSALDVEFSQSTRRVYLRGGEAFFAVAKDPSRPFVVAAGDTLVRAVGTRFNVNLDQARARVVVEEGIVEVLRATPDKVAEQKDYRNRPLRLNAGQQAVVRPDYPLPQAAEPLHGMEAGGWRYGRLSYRDAPLAEVVADANRYRAAPIRIAAPALAEYRITTSFRADQVEQMLGTLPDTLPVAVLRQPDGSVDLKPRPVRR